MHTDTNIHDPAVHFMNCGSLPGDRPTLGAWLSYGLGSENSDLPAYIVLTSGTSDGQPAAALLSDLKQRGLLDDTLVIWGGEFGRTPVAQVSGKTWGRDHHPHGFTMWLAGGGMRPGLTYGSTDEFGYHSVENPVHIHDLHATILHQMGIDHERLIFRTQGRDFRLTDVHGVVQRGILA